jgi:hypothetical protein
VKRSISSGSKVCDAALAASMREADLRFGLQLDVAQLAAQALEVVGQVVERALHLVHVGLDAGARDAHLAGLVDQAVEQRRAHAHGMAGGGRSTGTGCAGVAGGAARGVAAPGRRSAS